MRHCLGCHGLFPICRCPRQAAPAGRATARESTTLCHHTARCSRSAVGSAGDRSSRRVTGQWLPPQAGVVRMQRVPRSSSRGGSSGVGRHRSGLVGSPSRSGARSGPSGRRPHERLASSYGVRRFISRWPRAERLAWANPTLMATGIAMIWPDCFRLAFAAQR